MTTAVGCIAFQDRNPFVNGQRVPVHGDFGFANQRHQFSTRLIFCTKCLRVERIKIVDQ